MDSVPLTKNHEQKAGTAFHAMFDLLSSLLARSPLFSRFRSRLWLLLQIALFVILFLILIIPLIVDSENMKDVLCDAQTVCDARNDDTVCKSLKKKIQMVFWGYALIVTATFTKLCACTGLLLCTTQVITNLVIPSPWQTRGPESEWHGRAIKHAAKLCNRCRVGDIEGDRRHAE